MRTTVQHNLIHSWGIYMQDFCGHTVDTKFSTSYTRLDIYILRRVKKRLSWIIKLGLQPNQFLQ